MVNIMVTAVAEVELDDEAIQKWIATQLNAARNIFIRQMSRGGGTGRIYKRKGRTHHASAPGEYPVTDSGALVASIEWEMTGDREGRLFSELDYAAYLTTGTSKMAPRKMLPDALRDALMDAENDVLAQAVKVT